ncbi:Crp/Fnr family transcriptional regulator [Parasphingorhabdus sp. JC815]|uniref:Crp/Fnr family transcriptional regulator n=1 Tax=Parasphingorhabdus sp. JC815 TaxID=3232140 RepID=UPI003459AD12
MNQTDIASICSALRAHLPFADLAQGELEIIARHGKERTYKPGALILPKGKIADMLVVQTGGGAMIKQGARNTPAPAVFDAAGLLFGLATVGDYIAGPDGMDALLFAKPHVYTMALECPAFTIGVLHMQESHAP